MEPTRTDSSGSNAYSPTLEELTSSLIFPSLSGYPNGQSPPNTWVASPTTWTTATPQHTKPSNAYLSGPAPGVVAHSFQQKYGTPSNDYFYDNDNDQDVTAMMNRDANIVSVPSSTQMSYVQNNISSGNENNAAMESQEPAPAAANVNSKPAGDQFKESENSQDRAAQLRAKLIAMREKGPRARTQTPGSKSSPVNRPASSLSEAPALSGAGHKIAPSRASKKQSAAKFMSEPSDSAAVQTNVEIDALIAEHRDGHKGKQAPIKNSDTKRKSTKEVQPEQSLRRDPEVTTVNGNAAQKQASGEESQKASEAEQSNLEDGEIDDEAEKAETQTKTKETSMSTKTSPKTQKKVDLQIKTKPAELVPSKAPKERKPL